MIVSEMIAKHWVLCATLINTKVFWNGKNWTPFESQSKTYSSELKANQALQRIMSNTGIDQRLVGFRVLLLTGEV